MEKGRGFMAISLVGKILIPTIIVLFIMGLLSIFSLSWTTSNIETQVLEQTKDAVTNYGSIVLDAMNALMLSGTMDRKEDILTSIKGLPKIKELHLFRGENINRQYGKGDESEQPKDDIDRMVLSTGKPIYRVEEYEGKRFYRAVLPYLATRDYFGIDCLTCHSEGISDGKVLGGLSITIPIDKLDIALHTNKAIIMIGSILGILIITALIYLIINSTVKRPLKTVINMFKDIVRGDGDLTKRIEIRRGDEIGDLIEWFNRFIENLIRMIKKIRDVSRDVTMASQQIDIRCKRVSESAMVQISSLEDSSSSILDMNTQTNNIAMNLEGLYSLINEINSYIREMISSINEVANNTAGLFSSVEETTSSIEEMSVATQEIAKNIDVLASSAEETTASITQINTAIKDVEGHVGESVRLSEQVITDASDIGMRSIADTIEAIKEIKRSSDRSAEIINRLGGRSEEIGEILTVIQDITDQTNLLSLNAAILAAQAGEHGKGFAVVADEIKELAEKTATSTGEISKLITTVQSEVKDAVELVKRNEKMIDDGVRLSLQSGEALKKIIGSANKSNEMAKGIQKATVEQAKGTKHVTEAIKNISDMAQQIATATQQQTLGTKQIMDASVMMSNIAKEVRRATVEEAKGTKSIESAITDIVEKGYKITQDTQSQRKRSEEIVSSIEKVNTITKEKLSLIKEQERAVETVIKESALLKGEIEKFRLE
ncbi:MAG: methyl-accepting chemotaxis protein [Nitrospinae bacterium]|nr:methyl-accepting chemotaxis protein [Nitrospinota bacterium]